MAASATAFVPGQIWGSASPSSGADRQSQGALKHNAAEFVPGLVAWPGASGHAAASSAPANFSHGAAEFVPGRMWTAPGPPPAGVYSLPGATAAAAPRNPGRGPVQAGPVAQQNARAKQAAGNKQNGRTVGGKGASSSTAKAGTSDPKNSNGKSNPQVASRSLNLSADGSLAPSTTNAVEVGNLSRASGAASAAANAAEAARRATTEEPAPQKLAKRDSSGFSPTALAAMAAALAGGVIIIALAKRRSR